LSRRTLLVLTGLVVFVVALVATLPARVVLDAFAPPAVRAWGVEGSLWSGRAAAVAVGDAGIGGIEWELSPASLLALRVAADVRIRRLDGFLDAHVSAPLLGGPVRLTGIEAATRLETLPRSLVPDGTGGQMTARLDELTLADGWPTRIVGRIAFDALDLPGVRYAVGPLEFVFPPDRDPPLADARSLGGPLSVEGTFGLPGPRRWFIDALLGPGENAPRDLVDGLKYVGEEAPDGRRHVRYPIEG
jgi:hypothetical protein